MYRGLAGWRNGGKGRGTAAGGWTSAKGISTCCLFVRVRCREGVAALTTGPPAGDRRILSDPGERARPIRCVRRLQLPAQSRYVFP